MHNTIVYLLAGSVHYQLGSTDDMQSVIRDNPWAGRSIIAATSHDDTEVLMSVIDAELSSKLIYPNLQLYYGNNITTPLADMIKFIRSSGFAVYCDSLNPTEFTTPTRIVEDIYRGKTLIDVTGTMITQYNRLQHNDVIIYLIRYNNSFCITIADKPEPVLESPLDNADITAIANVPKEVAVSARFYIKQHFNYYVATHYSLRDPSNSYPIESYSAIYNKLIALVNEQYIHPALDESLD